VLGFPQAGPDAAKEVPGAPSTAIIAVAVTRAARLNRFVATMPSPCFMVAEHHDFAEPEYSRATKARYSAVYVSLSRGDPPPRKGSWDLRFWYGAQSGHGHAHLGTCPPLRVVVPVLGHARLLIRLVDWQIVVVRALISPRILCRQLLTAGCWLLALQRVRLLSVISFPVSQLSPPPSRALAGAPK
jgi:hypothetical protein